MDAFSYEGQIGKRWNFEATLVVVILFQQSRNCSNYTLLVGWAQAFIGNKITDQMQCRAQTGLCALFDGVHQELNNLSAILPPQGLILGVLQHRDIRWIDAFWVSAGQR